MMISPIAAPAPAPAREVGANPADGFEEAMAAALGMTSAPPQTPTNQPQLPTGEDGDGVIASLAPLIGLTAQTAPAVLPDETTVVALPEQTATAATTERATAVVGPDPAMANVVGHAMSADTHPGLPQNPISAQLGTPPISRSTGPTRASVSTETAPLMPDSNNPTDADASIAVAEPVEASEPATIPNPPVAAPIDPTIGDIPAAISAATTPTPTGTTNGNKSNARVGARVQEPPSVATEARLSSTEQLAEVPTTPRSSTPVVTDGETGVGAQPNGGSNPVTGNGENQIAPTQAAGGDTDATPRVAPSMVQRVEDAVRRLEQAPPPRSITVTIDEHGLTRVTVSLLSDGVRLSIPEGAQTSAALVNDLEQALSSRGFDMSREDRGDEDQPQTADGTATFRPTTTQRRHADTGVRL